MNVKKASITCVLSICTALTAGLPICKGADVSEVSAKEENVMVYDILGDSSKLKEETSKKLEKWRSGVKDLDSSVKHKFVINNQPESNTVYLTFDDGPDNKITPKIIEILKENGVKGNFFFVGSNVEKYPEVVKSAFENGNDVSGHCYSHSQLTKLDDDEIKKTILDANAAIEKITGVNQNYFRPPYGDINERVIKLASEIDKKIVLWSIDTLDWTEINSPDCSNIVQRVKDNVRPGDIILMHSNSNKIRTAEALPDIINIIKEKGLEIGVFSDWI